MKTKRITTKWKNKMAFETEINGHKLTLDAEENVGGEDNGPRPKALMEVSLAGCTGMDTISILKKMRVDVEDFKIHIDGEMTEEHPKHYSAMHITFEFTGKNLPEAKIQKAVNLSQDRYCGVTFIYNKAMKLTSEIIIHNTAE
ncbi:MAG: OsmC family protein [Bacteroidota bacterium]|nr:OsmC family protein [Bacteroidota bacterium]